MTPFLYHVEQRVLCYEPDLSKKRVLYPAKVLETRIGASERNEYLIHFQGWKSKWDRWADEHFVMEDNAETRKILATEGKRTKKQQAEATAAAVAAELAAVATAELAAAATAELTAANTATNVANNVAKFETPSKVVKSSASSARKISANRELHPRKKVTCQRHPTQAKQPHPPVDEPYLSSAAPSPGSVQTETSVEEQNAAALAIYLHTPSTKRRRPRFFPKFDIPSALIKQISEDMFKIKVEKKLHKLPYSISVAQILENSVRYFACTQANLPSAVKSKYDRDEKSEEVVLPEKDLLLYQEFVDSINRMFNGYLPSFSLLYTEEIAQYKKLCQTLKFPPLKSLDECSTTDIPTPSVYCVEICKPDSTTADNITNGNEMASDTLQQEDAEVEKVAVVKEARKDGKRAYPDDTSPKEISRRESAKRSRRDDQPSSTVNTTTTRKTGTKRSRGPSSRKTKKRRQVFNNLDLNHKPTTTTSSPCRRSAERLSIEETSYILNEEDVGHTGSVNDEHGRRRSNRIQSPTRLPMITEDQTTAEVALPGCSTDSGRIQSPSQQPPCHSQLSVCDGKDVVDMSMKVFMRPWRNHGHQKSTTIPQWDIVQLYCKNSKHACNPSMAPKVICKNNYISKAGRDATKAAALNLAWEFSLYPRDKEFSERINGVVPASMIYGFHHFIRFLDKFHLMIPQLSNNSGKTKLISEMFKFLTKFVTDYVKELTENSDYYVDGMD